MELIQPPKYNKKPSKLKSEISYYEPISSLTSYTAGLLGGAKITTGNVKITASNGQLHIYDLDEENKRTLWIPPSIKRRVKTKSKDVSISPQSDFNYTQKEIQKEMKGGTNDG